MDFVDKEENLPRAFLNRFDDLLNPLFKLSFEFGPRQERTNRKTNDLFVLEGSRDIVFGDALGQAFDDCGFADAGFADEDGVVFSTAQKNLDGTANFVVSPDNRIEFTGFGEGGVVDSVLREHFEILVVGLLLDAAAGAVFLKDSGDFGLVKISFGCRR